MKRFSFFLKEKYLFIFFLILLIFPFLGWFYLGEDSYITIHDNLDSEFTYIKTLSESTHLFDYSNESLIEQIMNGIPRNMFRSGLNVTFLLFNMFSDVYAYIFQGLVVHLVGYIGMYLLLSRYFLADNKKIAVIVSFLFAMVSYYHIAYGISISGQPLLLFAFLNILNEKKQFYNWAIILLFPFFSFISVTLPFFIPFLILIGFYNYFLTKKIPTMFFFALVSIVVVNLLIEYPLLYSNIIENKVISHRSIWNVDYPNIAEIKSNLKNSFKITQYHSGKINITPILVTFLIVLILFRPLKDKNIFHITSFILVTIFLSSASGFISYYLSGHFNFIKTVQIDRFYFLLPFLWLLLFSILLNKFNKNNKIHLVIVSILISVQFFNIIRFDKELNNNFKLLLSKSISEPTFKQFYAKEAFSKIGQKIHKRKEDLRIVSVGLFPNIALYNGFHVLDSYQNNYPLYYKKTFGRIIENELNKNSNLQNYFNNWGSRCYVFSSEIGKNFYKKNINEINLDINYEVLKAQKAEYIISSVKINNQDNCELIMIFDNPNLSYWKLHLYKLI